VTGFSGGLYRSRASDRGMAAGLPGVPIDERAMLVDGRDAKMRTSDNCARASGRGRQQHLRLARYDELSDALSLGVSDYYEPATAVSGCFDEADIHLLESLLPPTHPTSYITWLESRPRQPTSSNLHHVSARGCCHTYVTDRHPPVPLLADNVY
jgi:hypothetical protein